MSKVTSKLQVTIPKAIALRHGVQPGSEIAFESAGDSIRVRLVDPAGSEQAAPTVDAEFRLRLFDASTARQEERSPLQLSRFEPPIDRGWSREDLYERGDARPD